MLHGSTIYFSALEWQLMPNRVSAQAFTPVDDKLPRRLAELAHALLQYGLADSTNAERMTTAIDSLLSRLGE